MTGGYHRDTAGVPAINHEPELAIVIGKRAKRVDRAKAEECIFGYTCLNNVTAGIFQARRFRGIPLFRRRQSLRWICAVRTVDRHGHRPGNLHMECRVNGLVRQSHSTRICFTLRRKLSL